MLKRKRSIGDWTKEFSPRPPTIHFEHRTISRDNTANEHLRTSTLFAYLGSKLTTRHETSLKVQSIATPITNEPTTAPARIPGHQKHVDNHGQTLFAKACAKGEYETAKRRLAERPEDLNFADYAGNTPLQIASLNGHENIVQLLIEAGCNLDCHNSDKETPLIDAIENGHLAVVKLLLKAGVNPRKADAEGHEPLEKVPDDLDNAEEIRVALREAMERVGELHRTSGTRVTMG